MIVKPTQKENWTPAEMEALVCFEQKNLKRAQVFQECQILHLLQRRERGEMVCYWNALL